jgi:hypothetical protein
MEPISPSLSVLKTQSLAFKFFFYSSDRQREHGGFMRKVSTLLILFTFMTTQAAFSRGPAVEDFVGIEMDEPKNTTPQGTEVLFNFEKEIRNHNEKSPELDGKGLTVRTASETSVITASSPSSSFSVGTSTFFGIVFILTLPLLSWLMVMNHLRRKAGAASADNIAVLDQYRKNREQAKTEEIKKAS